MKFSLTFLMLYISINIYCQKSENDIFSLIDNLNIIVDDEGSNEYLYDGLLFRINNPINLNKADRSDLRSLFFLSDNDIELLLNHRDTYGNYLSTHELYLIEGIDSVVIDKIRPFIIIQNQHYQRDTLSIFNNIFNTSRRSITVRYAGILEKQAGFRNRKDADAVANNNYFIGTPGRIYGRIEVAEANDFSIGVTFEKDPGEAVFYLPSHHQYGFDHYSGYLNLKNRGILKELIIGNFQIQAGEGLLVGNGFYAGKGSNPVGSIKKHFNGFRPYQGSMENGSMRGGAATFSLGRFDVGGFYSFMRMDANIEQNGYFPNSEERLVTSLKTTGFHRTPQELNNKKNLVENTAGTMVTYNSKSNYFKMGLCGVLSRWDAIIQGKTTYYNQYDFSGGKIWGSSIFYNYSKGKYCVFGEAASSTGGGYAIVQGGMFNFSASFETSLLIRIYNPHYHAAYGRAFGEYSDNANETGIYWGFKARPFPRFEICGYIDIYQSKGMRYNIASPSEGMELLLKLESQFSKTGIIIISLKQESKARNISSEDEYLYHVGKGLKRNGQINLKFNLTNHISIKTRVQGSTFYLSGHKTAGFCVSQDMSFEKGIVRVHGAVAYFSSQDYFNRQYVYERDVLYSYSIPSYNGKGLRVYLLLKIRPSRFIDIWIKPSQYIYFDRGTVGSGLSMINGNKKSEIVCQVRIKF